MPHAANLLGEFRLPRMRGDRLVDDLERFAARGVGTAERAGLGESLPLPKLPAPFAEVFGELVERNRERAAAARGTQAGIDIIKLAEGAELVCGFHDPLRELAE